MTVEEKIISHIEQNCTYPDGSPMMDEQTFYEGAKWGYNEAMRWRDPKVELPENEEIVQVKCYSNNETWYEQLRYMKAHNVWACDQTIGAKVVGWKPIE